MAAINSNQHAPEATRQNTSRYAPAPSPHEYRRHSSFIRPQLPGGITSPANLLYFSAPLYPDISDRAGRAPSPRTPFRLPVTPTMATYDDFENRARAYVSPYVSANSQHAAPGLPRLPHAHFDNAEVELETLPRWTRGACYDKFEAGHARDSWEARCEAMSYDAPYHGSEVDVYRNWEARLAGGEGGIYYEYHSPAPIQASYQHHRHIDAEKSGPDSGLRSAPSNDAPGDHRSAFPFYSNEDGMHGTIQHVPPYAPHHKHLARALDLDACAHLAPYRVPRYNKPPSDCRKLSY